MLRSHRQRTWTQVLCSGKEPQKYNERVAKDLEQSKADIPAGFTMPRHEDAFKSKKQEEYIMAWEDSDEEDDFDDDFGGSESDVDMDGYESENPDEEDIEDTTVSDNDNAAGQTSEGATGAKR